MYVKAVFYHHYHHCRLFLRCVTCLLLMLNMELIAFRKQWAWFIVLQLWWEWTSPFVLKRFRHGEAALGHMGVFFIQSWGSICLFFYCQKAGTEKLTHASHLVSEIIREAKMILQLSFFLGYLMSISISICQQSNSSFFVLQTHFKPFWFFFLLHLKMF